MSDTLFLAISYVDRFLSMHAVPRAKLQLVGVACMLLAAKYEEIYAPQARPRPCAHCHMCAHTRCSKGANGVDISLTACDCTRVPAAVVEVLTARPHSVSHS